ncbi:MAG: hypothetical protein GY786_04760 [Proteobacteria bacterium]|nr:hypothetical protein [Pseudomonadota bacterium]
MSPEIREETQLMARSLCQKGVQLSRDNRSDEALEELNKAETHFVSLQSFEWLNYLRKEKLLCLKELKREKEVSIILEELEKGYLETSNQEGLLQTLIDKGALYYEEDLYHRSLKKLNSAYYVIARNCSSLSDAAIQLKIAQNKIALEEYIEALLSLNHALSIYTAESRVQESAYCQQLSGYCYEKLYLISEAEQQYSQARNGYAKVGDKASEKLILQKLNQLYLDSWQTKKANSINRKLVIFQ